MEYIQKIGIGSDGQMVVPKFTSDEQVGLTTESGSLLFNTDTNKYTTLQRSTLIEFLKDDIYTQHLRFG